MAGIQLYGVQASTGLAKAVANVAEAPQDAALQLAEQLDDDSRPGVRIAAARALADVGDHATPHAKAMADRICSNDAEMLRKAEASLKNMGQVGADAFGNILSHRNESVRINAVVALGQMGSEGAPVLVKHLADNDEHVRLDSGRMLARMGEIGARSLGKGLKDADALIRANAAKALGWMASAGGESASASYSYIPELLKLLNDNGGDGDVKTNAAEALMLMGSEGGEALATRLADENADVRRIVASSLLRMDDVGIVVLTLCLSEPSPGTRRHALALLTSLGPCGATALAACLGDMSDAGVRRRAAEGLGQMDAFVVAPHAVALAARLGDPDHWVQVAAARSLGKLGISTQGSEAASPLVQPFSTKLANQLHSDRKLVRHTAAQALGRAGAAVARPHAQEFADGLGQKDVLAQTKVAEALAEMGEAGPAAVSYWLRKTGEEPKARSRAALCRGGLLKGDIFKQAYEL
jgi:HEAT repeat protein